MPCSPHHSEPPVPPSPAEDTSEKKASTPFSQRTSEELRPAPAQSKTASNGVQWLAAPDWSQFGWLWHGFSTRHGGVTSVYAPEGAAGELNLGFTSDDDRQNVLRNRQLFAEAVTGDASTPIVTLRQVHSVALVVVTCQSAPGQPPSPPCEGDGIMTDRPGMLIGIQTADCVPILVVDRKQKAVAAFHAGWRGTVKGMVEGGIRRMRQEFGSRPDDLSAAIGPAIAPCCYSVGEEVLSEFQSRYLHAGELFHYVEMDTFAVPGHGRLHLDLFEANRRQLLAAGLRPESISIGGGCTACQPQMFFSHRAAGGRAGRMLSVIGIRPE